MFRVPESNRLTKALALKLGTPKHSAITTAADGNNGAFVFLPRDQGAVNRRIIWVIASEGDGWEHVSVHAQSRIDMRDTIPTWDEMCFVKERFWGPEDVVMQLHPRESQYVRTHPHVLHLWRPQRGSGMKIPEPHYAMVGTLPGQSIEEAHRIYEEEVHKPWLLRVAASEISGGGKP